MKQRKIILKYLAFILGNLVLFLATFSVFRSNIPMLAWLSGATHLIVLIVFPYSYLNE